MSKKPAKPAAKKPTKPAAKKPTMLDTFVGWTVAELLSAVVGAALASTALNRADLQPGYSLRQGNYYPGPGNSTARPLGEHVFSAAGYVHLRADGPGCCWKLRFSATGDPKEEHTLLTFKVGAGAPVAAYAELRAAILALARDLFGIEGASS